MSIWERYHIEQREKYIQFLQIYGALSNLFRQKQGELIPYLDSKFQETIYSKVFNCLNVDIGNTPHDVLSEFNNERIGIGIKTWMSSSPSFQKVMQLKRFQDEISNCKKLGDEALAYRISEIKNERMKSDYHRLGLSEDKNIYHYVTRDKGQFRVHECAYPLINLKNLKNFALTPTAISWSDGKKEYKFTFGDSQIWQKFDSSKQDTTTLNIFDINIIEDPFEFLLKAFQKLVDPSFETNQDVIEAYLPLYSYESNEVEEKSGLNAWNGAPKSGNTPRPLNEVYIPIPKEFHIKHPNFFTNNILNVIRDRKIYKDDKTKRPEVRFQLILPNGKQIPALLTGDNLKNFQSGSRTERDENGNLYGQSALGQWLLIDVLGLKERKLVNKEWLQKKDKDSVRLWRKKDDFSKIYIDFAPVGSFESFMKNQPILNDEEY